jgi:hypothetical protein
MEKINRLQAEAYKTQETVKICKTVFVVNHIFAPKQHKEELWLSIITRAENLRAKKN